MNFEDFLKVRNFCSSSGLGTREARVNFPVPGSGVPSNSANRVRSLYMVSVNIEVRMLWDGEQLPVPGDEISMRERRLNTQKLVSLTLAANHKIMNNLRK